MNLCNLRSAAADCGKKHQYFSADCSPPVRAESRTVSLNNALTNYPGSNIQIFESLNPKKQGKRLSHKRQ